VDKKTGGNTVAFTVFLYLASMHRSKKIVIFGGPAGRCNNCTGKSKNNTSVKGDLTAI